MLQPWQIVLLLLVPSLLWLGRGLWLWRKESLRRRKLVRDISGRWRNDE